MNVNEKLFRILGDKGISQKELSKMSGIPESTICDWKRKGKMPGLDKALIISRILGVSLYDLISDDSEQADDEAEADISFDYKLNNVEKAMIERYRALDDGRRKRVTAYFEELCRPQVEAMVPDVIYTWNNAGKNKGGDNIEDVFVADTMLLQRKLLARRLRKLAKLDRITLDETRHASGLNLHLLKYLDYIGLDKLEYIKKYLSNIQPFMISEIKSQEKFDNAICVLDECYRISLYIKVDATKGEEIVVSFHENNTRVIARRNSFIDNMSFVYVFADSIGSHVVGTENYTVNLFVTRGVATIPINVPATRYDEDGFLVRYTYINNAIIDVANRYLEDLYSSDIDFSQIELFSSAQQLSFTSLGNDIFSNISLMIDSLIIQNNITGKQIADSALCIYCGSLELLDSDKSELIDTLRERYKVNSVKALPQILERVELHLK